MRMRTAISGMDSIENPNVAQVFDSYPEPIAHEDAAA